MRQEMIILVHGKFINTSTFARGEGLTKLLGRHFAKEELPRLSYANQQLDIKVHRPDPREDPTKVVEPVIDVTFGEPLETSTCWN